uniref:Uncharacterized protein n=1 Tax=Nymphaea colorata TaxID=210225 RepID=A0A5K1A9U5_9MAGN
MFEPNNQTPASVLKANAVMFLMLSVGICA